jgi:DNA-binding GntR family transcriptional regulator
MTDITDEGTIAAADTIPRTSIVDTVTVRLRRAILTGEIAPGERIRVADLERRFGVSHIPIREALRRLESEGLVVTSPQRATLAAGVALEDLAGLYDLRRLIEVEVARRSAQAMTPDDLSAIRRSLVAMEAAAADHGADFWRLHREFHRAILRRGSSPWVDRTLDQLWLASERYVRLFVTTFGEVGGPMNDHRRMVEACEAGDADGLAELVERHLSRTEETVVDGYQRLRGEPGVSA